MIGHEVVMNDHSIDRAEVFAVGMVVQAAVARRDELAHSIDEQLLIFA